MIQGGYLDANGELDLTNSTLSLSGPIWNNGGQLTTSASTLTLNKNTTFQFGNDASFENYNPNGWGLVLYGLQQNSNNPPSVTLGKTGGTIVLEPSANAPSSGFVRMYNSDSSVEYSQDSHPIGVATSGTNLNVLGSIQLKNNAKIESSSGEVSIADLSLEKGGIVINGGTLSLGGGSVGADGELEMLSLIHI